MAKRRNARKSARRSSRPAPRIVTKIRYVARRAAKKARRGARRARRGDGGGFLAAVGKTALVSGLTWGAVKLADRIPARGVWRAAAEGGGAVALAVTAAPIARLASKVPYAKKVITRGTLTLFAGTVGFDALRRVVQDPGVRAAARRLVPGGSPAKALPEGGNVARGRSITNPLTYRAAR